MSQMGLNASVVGRMMDNPRVRAHMEQQRQASGGRDGYWQTPPSEGGSTIGPDGTEIIPTIGDRFSGGRNESLGPDTWGRLFKGEGAYIPGQHSSQFRGRKFNPLGGSYYVGGDGVVRTPGQELEVFGLNEFRRADQAFRQMDRTLGATARQSGLKEAVKAAKDRAGRVADVEAGVADRRLATMDISDRQRRAADRRLSLNREVARAGAGTGVRRGFADAARKAAIGAGSAEEGLRDIEMAGLTDLSNAAGAEKKRRLDEAAARKESQSGLIGSIVGTGLSILSMFSSEDYKHDKQPIRGSLLDRLKTVRVENWKYKGDDITNHIGPYAEEFNETFGVGQDAPDQISVIDSLGVLLGAVKELNDKVEANA